jgi:Ca2+-dependent lipid-binding protein
MDILHSCDAYCSLYLTSSDSTSDQYHCTRTVTSLNPEWNEAFAFDVGDETCKLVVSVWDRDHFTSDDLIGSADVPVHCTRLSSSLLHWSYLVVDMRHDTPNLDMLQFFHELRLFFHLF